MGNGILIPEQPKKNFFNYALPSSGLTSTTVQNEAFHAGTWYALFDGMSDGTVKLAITLCSTEGEIDVSARTGTTLGQWAHMAFELS